MKASNIAAILWLNILIALLVAAPLAAQNAIPFPAGGQKNTSVTTSRPTPAPKTTVPQTQNIPSTRLAQSGASVQAGALVPTQSAPVSRFDYRIKAGDELEILTWKEPNFSRKVLVRPDGKNKLPTARISRSRWAGVMPTSRLGRTQKRSARPGAWPPT